MTEASFIRLSINPLVVGRALSVAEAVALLSAIRATPGHRFIADDASLAQPHIDLTRVATHAQITDAHLVNLAAAQGAVLATLDARILDMLESDDRRSVHLLS